MLAQSVTIGMWCIVAFVGMILFVGLLVVGEITLRLVLELAGSIIEMGGVNDDEEPRE